MFRPVHFVDKCCYDRKRYCCRTIGGPVAHILLFFLREKSAPTKRRDAKSARPKISVIRSYQTPSKIAQNRTKNRSTERESVDLVSAVCFSGINSEGSLPHVGLDPEPSLEIEVYCEYNSAVQQKSSQVVQNIPYLTQNQLGSCYLCNCALAYLCQLLYSNQRLLTYLGVYAHCFVYR